MQDETRGRNFSDENTARNDMVEEPEMSSPLNNSYVNTEVHDMPEPEMGSPRMNSLVNIEVPPSREV